MNIATIICLICADLLLFFKLITNFDLTLLLTVIVIQLTITLLALNFELKTVILEKQPFMRGDIFRLLIIAAGIIPLLWFHQPRYEPSTWSEVRLFMQGPLMTILVLIAVAVATLSALASLYLRGKK